MTLFFSLHTRGTRYPRVLPVPVPASMMAAGTTEEVETYCADLLALYEDAPAYILSHGCNFENTTDEKLSAFINSVKK